MIGGASDGVASLDSVEVLDTYSGTNCAEAAIPPYPLASRGASAVLHPSGRIRVFGGLGGGGEEYLAESSELDPQTGEWSEPVRIGLPRAFAAATVVGDEGEVLISGGEVNRCFICTSFGTCYATSAFRIKHEALVLTQKLHSIS